MPGKTCPLQNVGHVPGAISTGHWSTADLAADRYGMTDRVGGVLTSTFRSGISGEPVEADRRNRART